MNCPKCGKEIPQDAIRCPECGEKIAEQENSDRERMEAERQERIRSAEERRRLEAERMEKSRLDRERRIRERQERDRMMAERRREAQRQAAERMFGGHPGETPSPASVENQVETETVQPEPVADEAAEKERVEQEALLQAQRLEKERVERERIEAEKRAEAERLRQEELRREQERVERERQEQERIEQERRAEEVRRRIAGLEAARAELDRQEALRRQDKRKREYLQALQRQHEQLSELIRRNEALQELVRRSRTIEQDMYRARTEMLEMQQLAQTVLPDGEEISPAGTKSEGTQLEPVAPEPVSPNPEPESPRIEPAVNREVLENFLAAVQPARVLRQQPASLNDGVKSYLYAKAREAGGTKGDLLNGGSELLQAIDEELRRGAPAGNDGYFALARSSFAVADVLGDVLFQYAEDFLTEKCVNALSRICRQISRNENLAAGIVGSPAWLKWDVRMSILGGEQEKRQLEKGIRTLMILREQHGEAQMKLFQQELARSVVIMVRSLRGEQESHQLKCAAAAFFYSMVQVRPDQRIALPGRTEITPQLQESLRSCGSLQCFETKLDELRASLAGQ